MFTINLTHDYARKSATDLKKYLKKQDIVIQTTVAQEAIAYSLRHKDWNRLVANIKKCEQQTSLTPEESTSSSKDSRFLVNTTLTVKDNNGAGNASIVDIYFALKSFLEDYPYKYNRMYLPEEHSDHLTDVGIHHPANGKANSEWIQLMFGTKRNIVYVKPKELDIFIPKNSDENIYLRLETKESLAPKTSNHLPNMPSAWFVDKRAGLPMSNDLYVESLPTVEEAGFPNKGHEQTLVKKYHTGTFLLNTFEPFPKDKSKPENTLDDDLTHDGAITNTEHRAISESDYDKSFLSVVENRPEIKGKDIAGDMEWSNTSLYGPIIPKALKKKSNNLKLVKGERK